MEMEVGVDLADHLNSLREELVVGDHRVSQMEELMDHREVVHPLDHQVFQEDLQEEEDHQEDHQGDHLANHQEVFHMTHLMTFGTDLHLARHQDFQEEAVQEVVVVDHQDHREDQMEMVVRVRTYRMEAEMIDWLRPWKRLLEVRNNKLN